MSDNHAPIGYILSETGHAPVDDVEWSRLATGNGRGVKYRLFLIAKIYLRQIKPRIGWPN